MSTRVGVASGGETDWVLVAQTQQDVALIRELQTGEIYNFKV
jgi:hypothetical protein